MFRSFVLLAAFKLCLIAGDVKSLDGLLNFDTNSNNDHEMILNQTGLGIGITPSTNLEVSGNALILNKLNLGSSSFSQNNLQIQGTFSLKPSTSSTGNLSLSSDSLVLVDASNGDRVVEIPLANQASGRMYTIKKISTSGNIHLSAGGNLIDQHLSITLAEQSSGLASLKLISDGSQWWILNLSNTELSKLGSSNLILEYRLDETSGSQANDDSSNNRNAFLDNDHSFSGNSISAPQASGLQLDDDRDLLTYDHNTTIISSAYTWSFWVNSIIDPDDASSFNMAEVNEEVFGFNWNSGNTLWRKAAFHKLSDETYVLAQATSDIAANSWVHVAASWDGADLKLYLNGLLESSVTAASLDTHEGIVKLRNPGGASNPIIKYDQFMLYDKALSDSEIWALFSAGTP